MRYADLFMMVSPEFAAAGPNLHLLEGEHVSHFFVHWLDLAAPLAIGGLWVWMFLTQLRQRPLLAAGDPVPARVARERGRSLMAAPRTGLGGAGFVSPDAEYAVTPPGAGYEHTDANVWIIVKFGLWLVVSAVVIHVGVVADVRPVRRAARGARR